VPTDLKQGSFYATPEELADLRRQAREKGLTFSSFVRRKLKLPALKHGAEAGNKRNPFGRAGKKEA